jgi:hypothetical protein
MSAPDGLPAARRSFRLAAMNRWDPSCTAAGWTIAFFAFACSHHSATPVVPLEECDAGTRCGLPGTVTGGGTGTGGGGSSGTDAASCGVITFGSAACNSCMGQSCCARDMTCSNNTDCLTLISCVRSCAPSNQTCVSTCRTQSQNGIAAYDNLIDCMTSSCSTVCGSTEGGTSCGAFVFSNPACDACVGRSCCTEEGVCSNNADCLALIQCTSVCLNNDPVCIADCQTQHPNGSADYKVLAQCIQTSCGGQCP